MAGFKFKLDPLLAHRRRLEDQCLRDMAAVQHRINLTQREIATMQQTIAQARQDLTQSLGGRIDLDAVRNFARFSQQAAARATQHVHDLAGVHRELDAARQKLLEAKRSRESVELLRRRHYDRWLALENAREDAELDDITQQMHHQRNQALQGEVSA